MNKTTSTKPNMVERNWYLLDAQGQVLGKLAEKAASLLIGKQKPYYTPNLDVGDYVVIINASKIRVTGNKMRAKTYFRHSGYPGGAKTKTLEQMLASNPIEVVEKSVRGMLPSTKLGRRMITKLYVYEGDEHPHEAQKPKKI